MVDSEMMSGHYYSDEVNIIDKLYSPCFRWANHYVRNAGYFSSHIYQAMSKDVLEFILRDESNHITLFTNIDIYPPDYDAIVNDMDCSHEQVMQELRDMLEEETIANPVKMLAAIVASGQMTVYVTLRKRSAKLPNSIDHSKSGFFYLDEDNIVAFSGSFNETYPAVIPELDEGNKEHFDIHNKTELSKSNWEAYGEKITNRLNDDMKGPFPKNSGKGTIIVKIEDIKREDLPSLSSEDWNPKAHLSRASKRSNEIYSIMDEKIRQTDTQLSVTLFNHQSDGLEAWRANNSRGILEHATGSGKTITAISAVNEHISQGLPALILVPGRELLKQWEEEIKKYIIGASILCVGDEHKIWKNQLHFWLDHKKQPKSKRITIAIIHTARGDLFQKSARNLSNCLVVVDECHRIGAPSFGNICSWESDYVLGLSATPNRFSDPEGTQRMIDFCGDVVHTYTIDEAMNHGRLSKYFYYVSQVGLTNDHDDCGVTECSLCETDRYNLLMERVSSALVKFRDDDGLIKFNHLPKSVQVMIFNAKRILKRAHNKTDRCVEIIDDNYLTNSNQFWLIYCQDRRQLGQLKEELRLNNIGPVYEFWSEAEGASTDYEKLDFDRQATLAMWESTGGIMLSIQCLDEGVNIPCISHGIILASSQNPRQFIQRRGRLLRLSENKTHAKIWDILVIPESDEVGDHRNYVFSELNRALTFSSNASNHHALQEIQSIAYRLGLTLELPIWDFTDGEENDE